MTTEVLGKKVRRHIQPVNRTRERIFFSGMALLMIATILLGFRQTYFPLGERPAALASPIIIVHGAVFSLWLLMFFVQTSLIAAHRTRWHMKLGLGLYCLAALMIPLGIIAAADELRRDLAAGVSPMPSIDPRSFSLVSVMGMVMFGTLMALSYVARHRPDVHKRLALYAVLSMMNAGIDRWPFQAWGITQSWSPWIYTAFLLLPVLYDLTSLHRIHWATIYAASFTWILYKLWVPLGFTHAWHAVTNLMLRLPG
jgi:hypothetical protein